MTCDDVKATPDTGYDPVQNSSDIELSHYVEKLRLAQRYGPRVVEISDKYVTKSYREQEIHDTKHAIDFAASLGVRVPAIRRLVPGRNGSFECVQDRIDGANLMDCWTSLGWVSTIRLAFQLRAMVGKMRRATSPTAGSLGTGNCRSFWIEDRHGLPISPSARVIACVVNFWFNHVSFRQEARKTPEDHTASVAQPIKTQSLVFTHHDLAPRNLMLDTSGLLWIVDWDYAGWYHHILNMLPCTISSHQRRGVDLPSIGGIYLLGSRLDGMRGNAKYWSMLKARPFGSLLDGDSMSRPGQPPQAERWAMIERSL